ncbi:MAG: prohibitin family protein [Lachnospiraceae bacterium]|nr:prohibitin family protein [Lachnospiraceae bacterium]
MTTLVLSLILLAAGFICFTMRKHANLQAGQSMFTIMGIGAFILSAVFAVSSCVRVVPTGHTGVVTTFGKVEDVTYEAGINFVAPWKKVTNMDNRTQKASLALNCFSSDIQEVTLTYTVNYQIDKANAQTIYKTIGVDYFEKVVQPKILEAVKGVFAKYNAESLIASRGILSTEVEEILSDSLSQYNVQLVSTSIEDIDFTDSFTDAVEAKQVAEQNKLRAQTEQEQAIIEANAKAEMKVIEANAQAESQIVAAQADAEVAKIGADAAEYQGIKDAAIMSNLGEMLQKYPELIKYYYATNWNGELPETMLGENASVLMQME